MIPGCSGIFDTVRIFEVHGELRGEGELSLLWDLVERWEGSVLAKKWLRGRTRGLNRGARRHGSSRRAPTRRGAARVDRAVQARVHEGQGHRGGLPARGRW